MFAKDVRDLEAYKTACGLQNRIFTLTKSFPREEMYSLTDQIRRSSRSIGANISEAWAKRRYPAHFVSKLTDAHGEAEETIHWINTGHECAYISGETRDNLVSTSQHIIGMLNKMIEMSDSWCKPFLGK